jgi:hypothetical protein
VFFHVSLLANDHAIAVPSKLNFGKSKNYAIVLYGARGILDISKQSNGLF